MEEESELEMQEAAIKYFSSRMYTLMEKALASGGRGGDPGVRVYNGVLVSTAREAELIGFKSLLGMPRSAWHHWMKICSPLGSPRMGTQEYAVCGVLSTNAHPRLGPPAPLVADI